MTLKEFKKNPLLQFLISIVVYQCGTIIRLQLDSQAIGNALRILSFFILCYSLLNQLSYKRKKKLSFLMIFLLIWNTLNIAVTIFSGKLNLTRTFGEETYILNYILPFLLLYNEKYIPLKEIFKYSIVFEIFALMLIALNFQYIAMANNIDLISNILDENIKYRSLAQIPIMWSIPASILFFNYQMVKKKYIIISLLAFILSIGFSMTFGRRSTSAYGLLFLFSAFWFYISYAHIQFRKKILIVVISIIFIVIAIYYIMNHFLFLTDRGLENTREGVSNAFYADMSTIDYIFGRGINGTYYDPLNIFDELNNKRTGIETGYLNIILHSGLLFFIPYTLICLQSTIKGFFNSKNLLVKSMAIYIFINYLLLTFGSYPAYNLRFFILWIAILFCNSALFRNMDNRMIKHYFGFT